MVHLDLFNPIHKLRLITRQAIRGSKRLFNHINREQIIKASASSTLPPQRRRPKINVFDLIKEDLPSVPDGGLVHNAQYYKDDSEGGFCIFRVENTLFKVHKCYLLREPSAFGDMFSLPCLPGNREGLSDDTPIPLFDTADQFQDLLWVLYAIPSQLYPPTEAEAPSLERLLNIAEMTNKYCIASYETWALDRLLTLAQNPVGFLRTSSSALCARALNIAAICNHQRLLDVIHHRLIPRILWSDVHRQPILEVALRHGLRKLQGVLYYKELVDLDRTSSHETPGKLEFPKSFDQNKRMKFLSAHHSLTSLWECVAMAPPPFIDHGCTSHADCLAAWTEIWVQAASAHQTLRHSPVDVLGRLKAMMIILKKSVRESNEITLGCTLAALEAITITRDDIIAGLMAHFQDF